MTGLHRDNPAPYPMPNGAKYRDWLRGDIEALAPVRNTRFRVWSAADAVDSMPKIEWIVENLFSAGSVSIVFGDGGSKKTFCMLDLSVCVATGAKWLDLAVTKCPVLFIDEEAGKRKILARLRMCRQGHEIGEGTPLDIYGSSFDLLNICDPKDIADLRILIQEYGARFVIIDAFIDAARDIENENDAVKVQAVFRLLRPLADELQVAIVLIDHTNKSNGYRGSTAKKGGVDCMLGVTSASGSAHVAFHIEKARDTEPFKFAALANYCSDVSFLLSPVAVQGGSGLNGSKWSAFVLQYLVGNGPRMVSEIVAASDGLKAAGARKVIGKLIDEKKMRRANDGGKGTRAIYEAI